MGFTQFSIEEIRVAYQLKMLGTEDRFFFTIWKYIYNMEMWYTFCETFGWASVNDYTVAFKNVKWVRINMTVGVNKHTPMTRNFILDGG